MNTYWATGIAIFLCVLSIMKYSDRVQLKFWIDKYLVSISPKKEVVELEEVADVIYDFVIRNQKLFSNIKVKDGCTS